MLWLAILVPQTALDAASQQTPGDPPVSVERIREELDKPAPRRLESNQPLQVPLRFRTRNQPVFVPTLQEHLHKEFDLNLLQRQSAEWASKCCGFNLGALATHARNALRERKIRKTREQIARELAELDAARSPLPVK
jgi:hypothetical protein